MSSPSGREVATAYATIVPKAPNFARDLERQIRGDIERVGTSVGDSLAESIAAEVGDIDTREAAESAGDEFFDGFINGVKGELDRQADRTGKEFGEEFGEEAGKKAKEEIEDDLDDLPDDGDETGRKYGRRFESGFKRAAKGLGKGLAGLVLGGGLLAGAGIAAGAVGVTQFLGDSIQKGIDLNETLNKTREVFGGAFSEIDAYSRDTNRALTLTREQALDTAAQFGLFGAAAGLQGKPLAEFSTNLTDLSQDLVSFFNSDAEATNLAIGAALRGEFEPIRQFGVLLDQDTLSLAAIREGLVETEVDATKLADAELKLRKAQEKLNTVNKDATSTELDREDAALGLTKAQENLAGVLEGNVPELTTQQRVQAAYAEILRQTDVASGDAAATIDDAANSQRQLLARFEDTKAEIGQALLPAYTDLLGVLKDDGIPILQDFAEFIVENKDGISDYAIGLAASAVGIGANLAMVGGYFFDFGAVVVESLGIAAGALADFIEGLPDPVKDLLGIDDTSTDLLREIERDAPLAADGLRALADESFEAEEQLRALEAAINDIPARKEVELALSINSAALDTLGGALSSIPRAQNFNPDAPSTTIGTPLAREATFNLRDSDGVLLGTMRGEREAAWEALLQASRNKAAGAL